MKNITYSGAFCLVVILFLTACSSASMKTCVFPGLSPGVDYGYSYRYDNNFYAGTLSPNDSGEAEVNNLPSDFPCDQVLVESLVVN